MQKILPLAALLGLAACRARPAPKAADAVVDSGLKSVTLAIDRLE